MLKRSEKGDIQLVVGDDGRQYVRRYRDIPRELFERLHSLDCPFTERLIGRYRDENGAYVISEYIDGTPACDRSFSESEAVNALNELCAALISLHNAGIIHRDVKPSNIIAGTDGHIRLIDFDAARLTKRFACHDTTFIGTEGFAPPEQFGFMQTDSRSDIYSFGVTMKEILGGNADKPKYRRIIKRCTRFDPEKRYHDMTEVSRAIKRASRPNYVPYISAAAAALTAPIIVFCVNGKPAHTAAPTQVLSEEITLEITGELTDEMTGAVTDEVTGAVTDEVTGAVTDEVTGEVTDEVTGEVTHEMTGEVTDEMTGEVTEEITPEISFTTIALESGTYRDEFEYKFYDDPSVHGTWRALRVLPGDTDITAITREVIFNAEGKSGVMYEFVAVYPDGTLAFYQPNPDRIEPTNLWTNGYYISDMYEGGLVCRMKTITVENNKTYLVLEQRSADINNAEKYHRYILYYRVES